MTIADWLGTRTPPVPPPLADRVRELLGREVERDAAGLSDVFLRVAEARLAEFARRPRTSREDAFELLAIDALVTYAFEASAPDPEATEARARAALTRLGALAAGAAP